MESVAWSRSHGAGRMEPVVWSRSHGVGHMESVTWSRSHGFIKCSALPVSESGHFEKGCREKKEETYCQKEKDELPDPFEPRCVRNSGN